MRKLTSSDQTYSYEEREVMLQKMTEASNRFYVMATAIGCHPFIELTGLMNELIEIYRENHELGFDFTQADTHSGKGLNMKPHQMAYISEKLDCIFGPTLQDPLLRRQFINVMLGDFHEPAEPVQNAG
jgi:hypothetical protein